MKKLLCIFLAASSACFGAETWNGDAPIDIDFYNKNLIEVDGHIWRIVMLYHHESCPCHENDPPEEN